MKPIATQEIWFESSRDLITRWFNRQSSAKQAELVSPGEVLERVEQRAQKILAYSGLKPLRRLKTAREWEARWEAKAAWKFLAEALDQLGYDAVRETTGASDAALSMSALYESDREAVLIVDAAVQAQLDAVKNAGMALPLTLDDMACIALARETYALLGEKMGRPPRPWVDDLGQHAFAQEVLGLPFNPLVFALI